MAITGASLQPIYDRLHAATPYHPMSANTFADWSVEAGDIVSMSRGGETISVPVHSTNISWRGSPMVKLNATGKEERDSIAKTSKRKYGGSGAGMRNNQSLYYEMFSEDGKLHTELMYSESILRIEFTNADSRLEGEISITASALRAEYMDGDARLRGEIEVTASHIYADYMAADSRLEGEIEVTASHLIADYIDRDERLRGEFELTASHLRSEFQDADEHLQSELLLTASMFQTELVNTASGLSSRITQTANKVAIVVDGNNNIKAAQIVAAINADGSSEAIISADHVYLDGNTTINSIISVTDRTVYISAPMRVNGDIMAESFTTRNGSNSATISDFTNVIKSASVSGNELTLTPVVGEPITFSKATALSPEWSGRTYTVEATQNGQRVGIVSDSVYVFPQGTAQYSNFSISVAHTTPTAENELRTTREYVYLVEDVAGKKVDAKYQNATTGSTYASVSTADTWQDGFDSAEGHYTAVNAYRELSSGGAVWYAAGTTENYYKEVASGGTVYYTAGTAGNYYRELSSGGAVYYSAGTTEYYYKENSSGTTYYTAGTAANYYKELSSGGAVYYSAGSSGYYYKEDNNGTTYYTAGTAANYYKELGSGGAVYYSAGSPTTYYNAGTTTKYARGDTVTVTPVGTTYYYVQHAAGTTPTGVWYTRTIAKPSSGTYDTRYAAGTAVTYYQGNGGSFTVQGSSTTVTPINANSSIRVDSRSSVTPIGSTSIKVAARASVTPINSNSSIRVDSKASVTPISSTSIKVNARAYVTPINSNSSIRVDSRASVTPISSTSIRVAARGLVTPINADSSIRVDSRSSVTPISSTSIRVAAKELVTPIDPDSSIRVDSRSILYKKS